MISRCWIFSVASCVSICIAAAESAPEVFDQGRLLVLASNVATRTADAQGSQDLLDRFRQSAETAKEKLDVDVVRAVDYLNTADTNDVLRGRALAQQILTNRESTWHRDWAYIYLAAADGLLADYSNQIVAATTALNSVNHSRVESEQDPLFRVIAKQKSSPDVRSALRLMLVNAYCQTAQIDEADRVCADITDHAIRERARNLIEYTRKASRRELP